MSMIEVFKTDVKERDHANMLIDQIHKVFTGYRANFDLEDCDRILRVESTAGVILSSCVVDLLNHFGFQAEVLPDLPQPVGQVILTRLFQYPSALI